MSLEKTIMEDIKTAMKAKDKVALESLRAVKTALSYAKTEAQVDELSEADEISILQKQVKMRKEAAEQFTSQGRDDMAEKELQQVAVIEKFLPQQLSEDELAAEITAIIQQEGASGMKDMGKVVGIANKNLAGRAEGKAIAGEVKKQLNA